MRLAMAIFFAIAAFMPQRAGAAKVAADTLSIRDVFVSLQSEPVEILKKTTRLDMLDYWDADSVYKAVNAMDGLSWIEACTPEYMKVLLTPVSTLELRMLHRKKVSTVVASVYTVGSSTQAEDSEVRFYDDKLNELDSKEFFKTPELKDFFDIPKGAEITMKEIKDMIPFPTVAYSISPGEDFLTARLTVGKYMDVDNYKTISRYLRPEIRVKLK